MQLDKEGFINSLKLSPYQRNVLIGVIEDEKKAAINEFLDWAYSGALETMQVIEPNDPKWRFDIGVFNTNEDLINHYTVTL